MVLDYNLKLAEALDRASVFLQEAGHSNPVPIKEYWMQTFDMSLTQLVLGLNTKITNEQVDRFNLVLERLAKDEPIQYITGNAYFAGNLYHVTPATLIPREDSYGIISLALPSIVNAENYRILDIGTGSGVLAIELARHAPQASVTAIDISSAALEVAKKNADMHQVTIDWHKSDLFSKLDSSFKYDLIVCNPPYISQNEVDQMDRSVIGYEPHQALFAEEDGMYIYQEIAKQIGDYLQPRGKAIFEIGYRQGQKVSQLFVKSIPNSQVTLHQDLQGKDRYVYVERKG